MSDQYRDRLQEEVKIVELCLARIGQHLVSPELTPLADWRILLQEATSQCRAKSEQAQQAGQRIKAGMREINNEAGVSFDDSNLDGEVEKAESQAGREEALALDALVVSAHAILQAEVAILKAFNSRKRAFDLARFGNVS